MKIYSRILGIIIFLLSLFLFCLVVYSLFESDTANDKLTPLAFLVPIYIVVHFLVIHRFGFGTIAEFSSNQGKSIMITSLILFSIFFPLIVWQTIETINLKERNEIQKKEREELDAFLAELKTWEKQSAFGFVGELKTKYDGYLFYYQFKIESKIPFNPNSVSFRINFLDKDGFLIESLDIVDYTIILENGNVYGISSNSNTNLFPLESSVLDIAKWELIVKKL